MSLEMIASPLLQALFDQLSSLIGREYHLLRGFNKDLEKLSSTLSKIKTVLESAEAKQINDKGTRDWLSELKDAAYDAEDVLDECEYEALQQEREFGDTNCTKQVSESFSACFDFKQIFFRRKMGKRIKEIIDTFNEIDAQRLFQLTPGVVVTGVEEFSERETSSILTEPIVCGRARETESIIGILLNNSSSSYDLSICPIVGIGGLGKTTLAQLVYNDERVVNQFDTKIWICVSGDFGVKRVTNMIINHLSEKKWDIEDLDPTQNQLNKLLNGRKYLLVLDDVWDDDREKWNKIIHLLACGGKGSSIIVTTRLQAVVTSMTSLQSTISARLCVINPTINLEYLLEHDCRSLFKHYAFGAEGEENQNFTQIGEEIVKKCGGLPLAIKAVGSLLNSKSEAFWRIIGDSELWALEEHGESTILPALRLSYNHLPPFFRQCFGYCSVYPKNSLFQKENLINEWMANGFIQSRGGMEVEEIGDQIFKGLWQRSFFENVGEDVSTGGVKFKMHDLVHDLACSVMKECSRMKISTVEDSPQRVRHLSLICDSPYSPNTLPTLFQPFLRTLVFIVDRDTDLSKIDLFQPSFSRLKYLRTLDLGGMWNLNKLPPWIDHLKLLKYLDLENTGIALLPEFVCCLTNLQVLLLGGNRRLTELPSSMGRLKNLRYLDLSRTSIKVLPESISTLTNLQTLKLWFCRKLERLPREMKNLKSLRNLIIMWEADTGLLIRSMPVGIGELIRLETLEVFAVSDASEGGAGIQELGRLNRLKGSLTIKDIRHVRDPGDAEQANLKNKDKLSGLSLFWGSSEDAEDEGEKNTSNQVLEALEPHSNLQVLRIREYPGVELPGWVGNCALTLPNLQTLELIRMPNVVHDLHQLPHNLEMLWIAECPKVRLHPGLIFPSSIRSLSVGASNDPTLRSVEALPHLSKLRIDGFREDEITLPRARLRNLTCLRDLRICNCSNVKRLLPKLDNLAETLRRLKIIRCDDLDCIAEEGLRNLASLQKLIFRGCRGLTSLSDSPSSLGHLKSLIRLELIKCPKLVLSAVDFQHLVALKYLFLQELPQLESLPDGIQHVTTLQKLHIRECKNLRTLPEWLLQQHLPPSLFHLQIRGCHQELHKRCEVDKGEDWHKISHLQVVNME